ncbi:hypothetical protein HXA31_20480 [Salipaludibacillus agaradhaerens]|uniref:Uncharacterized protein n=1 Tax=Salipaludibacillus agaradhaerens TaxID=76935 RepID=A0A9Q4B2P2_SALAG|nr:hypothetical protein [Salipaludibacillus agaradhaerens]MCR6096865.1 hypothetical protein [Salipaludibacillus agaradhaerens]MCR6116709.1 hypothetical protein [Salipaludibacillus agaradhaerens]
MVTDRFFIVNDHGCYYRVDGEPTTQIYQASLFHIYDDACILANQLNLEKDGKHIVKKVTVTYDFD